MTNFCVCCHLVFDLADKFFLLKIKTRNWPITQPSIYLNLPIN